MSLSLNKIFAYLTDKEEPFMSNTSSDSLPTKVHPILPFKRSIKFTTNSKLLKPNQTQPIHELPSFILETIGTNHMHYAKVGINQDKQFIQSEQSTVNVSFFTSLHVILDTGNQSSESTQTSTAESIASMIKCIRHRVESNYDHKTKNINSLRERNKKILDTNLKTGTLTLEFLKYVANIFDINLVVFDTVTNITHLYWCDRETNHNEISFFKDLCFMTVTDDCYEPIKLINPTNIPDTTTTYKKLLLNSKVQTTPIKITYTSLLYINTWSHVTQAEYSVIISSYLHVIDISSEITTAIKKWQEKVTRKQVKDSINARDLLMSLKK